MNAETRPQYEKFVRYYLTPLKKRLGWEEKNGEEDTLKDLRAELLKDMGTFAQDQDTIKEASDLFNKYLKNRESVSPDVIASVLSVVAYNGGDIEYEAIKNGWKNATNPQEEKRFLNALAEFRHTSLVDKTLELALSPDVRATDTVSLLSALLANRDSNAQAWRFTREHWNEFSKKFPPRFNKRIAASCANFDTPEREKDLRAFFAAHPLESAASAIARALEEVHVSVLYREHNEARIRQWVVKQAETLKD
jgi:puromycin-sensitive aminopeptidase